MFIKGNNIIISVDDFGISQKANENILKLVETGKIDRLAVMVHGNIRQEDVARLLASGILLDLHADVRSDINPKRKLKDGATKRVLLFILNYMMGNNRPKHIEKRFEEQIQAFQALFKKNPDGLNTHEHVHFFPPYFNVLLRLSQKYDIPHIRFGKESPHSKTPVSLIIYMLRKLNMKSFMKSGRVSSDMMFSFDWIKDFRDLEKHGPNKKIEIIFHPERDEEMHFLDNLKREL